ncbi:hypothetical protein EUX98_g4783 [Antrodiella citrinella]|uniref:Uncharacterized protein n=1 Tax=Antrodiella citrinella TaxID=2447956 RepID=A0A4S4N140_9APHY|nr:hypothetical protein EUX98_g4783 [Antrodiella citrinella]
MVNTAPSVHIDAFFARHASFNYDPTQPIMQEFRRMTAGWGQKRRQKQMWNLRDAIAEQFNAYYGVDVNSDRAWREICAVLQIYPVPESMTKRKKAVKRLHVNIYDYIEAKRLGEPVKKFKSVGALAGYSYAEEKIFPLAHAKAGGLLKYLLKELSAHTYRSY